MDDFTVTITDPERAAEWMQIFGTTTLNVVSPLPQRVNLPGHPHADAYFLDIEMLNAAQLNALIKHISEKFHIPDAEVKAAIDKEPQTAIPILSEHCIVTIENPQKWF